MFPFSLVRPRTRSLVVDDLMTWPLVNGVSYLILGYFTILPILIVTLWNCWGAGMINMVRNVVWCDLWDFLFFEFLKSLIVDFRKPLLICVSGGKMNYTSRFKISILGQYHGWYGFTFLILDFNPQFKMFWNSILGFNSVKMLFLKNQICHCV